MNQERKNFSFEIKTDSENASVFEGYSAGIGNRDLHDDVIEPGAFTKTIKERVAGKHVKLLDNHLARSADNVLGVVSEAKEVPVGEKTENGPTHKLWTKFNVSKDDISQRVIQKVRDGILSRLSIGYKPIAVEYVKDEGSNEEDPKWAWLMGQGTRKIKELAWYETSIVLWPANEEATIIDSSLKTLTHFSEICRESKQEIPPRYMEAAVKALSSLIELEVPHEQVESVKRTIADIENRTQKLEKAEQDIIKHLVTEYKQGQDKPSKEHFFMWFATEISDKESKGVIDFYSTVTEVDGDVEAVKEESTEDVPVPVEEKDADADVADPVRKAITDRLDEISTLLKTIAVPEEKEHDEPTDAPELTEAAESTSSEELEATKSTSETNDEDQVKSFDVESTKIALAMAELELNFND